MLKKKVLFVVLVCFGLFLFSNSDSSAQTKEVFLGYAVLKSEGMIEHAVMVTPGDFKQVLYLGKLDDLPEDIAECFVKSIGYGFEVEIHGHAKTDADGTKSLILNEEITCDYRN